MFTSSKILSVVVNHFIVGHYKGTIIKHAITVELGLRNSFARLGKTESYAIYSRNDYNLPRPRVGNCLYSAYNTR